jgi:nicotinate-nucleotide pyrophosphorylase
LDSKVSATSGFYFLKGRVETLEQIEARGDKSDRILLDNMKCNGWNQVVRTSSFTLPLEKGDVVLSYS